MLLLKIVYGGEPLKTQIRVIGLNAQLPSGWEYLTSWKCEELLCKEPEAFKLVLKGEYYKCVNGESGWRGSFLFSFNYDASFSAGYRDIDDYYRRLRGVLIIKQKR